MEPRSFDPCHILRMCRRTLPEWPAVSDASVTPANAASKLSCRAPRVTWSGRRSPAMRVRRVSPPRTFCGSKRASCCLQTSCVFRSRLRSSSSAGLRPKRALHAGITRQRERRVRLLCFQALCDSEPLLWQPPHDARFPPAPGSLLTTSACRSVVTSGVLGLGYALAAPRPAHLVDPAGQFHEIREVSLPFFDPRKRRPRGGWRDDL